LIGVKQLCHFCACKGNYLRGNTYWSSSDSVN